MSTCRNCHAPMRWALDVLKGRRLPYDATPVPAGTEGSRILATVPDDQRGETTLALGLTALVDSLREADSRLTYDAAMRRAYDEFPWHLPHNRTCPNPPKGRPDGR